MITFQEHFKQIICEAKFREVSEDVQNVSKEIAELFLTKFKNLTDKEIKRDAIKVSSYPPLKEYLKQSGAKYFVIPKTFNLTDSETGKPIKISLLITFGDNRDSDGSYDSTNNIMLLYGESCKRLGDEELEAVVAHELTHATQQYKKMSDVYVDALHKMAAGKSYDVKAYYLEPRELDAQSTELAYRIKQEFEKRKQDINKAKDPVTKKMMEKKLEKFVLELKLFVRSGIETYFKYRELPVPAFVSNHEEYLETLRSEPRAWKTLKGKLVNLYIQLTGEQP